MVPTWLTVSLLAVASAAALVLGGDGSWWWALCTEGRTPSHAT